MGMVHYYLKSTTDKTETDVSKRQLVWLLKHVKLEGIDVIEVKERVHRALGGYELRHLQESEEH